MGNLIRLSLTLAIAATILLGSIDRGTISSMACADPMPPTDLVRVGDCVINLANVTYVRFMGQGEPGTPVTSAQIFFSGDPNPLIIHGRDADQFRSILLGMGLPNADKAGPFDPTEANRRGFGNPNSGTFGAMGVPAQGGGIYVTGSLEGSPSAAVGLENGDVIVSINGFLVNTQAEFVQAVHNSPDVMNFIVRNVRTGQNQQMSVRLNRPLRANPPGVRAIEQARPVDPMPAPPPPPIPVEKKAENPQPSRK